MEHKIEGKLKDGDIQLVDMGTDVIDVTNFCEQHVVDTIATYSELLNEVKNSVTTQNWLQNELSKECPEKKDEFIAILETNLDRL